MVAGLAVQIVGALTRAVVGGLELQMVAEATDGFRGFDECDGGAAFGSVDGVCHAAEFFEAPLRAPQLPA